MNIERNNSLLQGRQYFYELSRSPLDKLKCRQVLTEVFGKEEEWVEVKHLKDLSWTSRLVDRVFCESKKEPALAFLHGKITESKEESCKKLNDLFLKIVYSRFKSNEDKQLAQSNKEAFTSIKHTFEETIAEIHAESHALEQENNRVIHLMRERERSRMQSHFPSSTPELIREVEQVESQNEEYSQTSILSILVSCVFSVISSFWDFIISFFSPKKNS